MDRGVTGPRVEGWACPCKDSPHRVREPHPQCTCRASGKYTVVVIKPPRRRAVCSCRDITWPILTSTETKREEKADMGGRAAYLKTAALDGVVVKISGLRPGFAVWLHK